ncbi:MAG TPA: benzoyl-CoA reductase subunit A [Bacteroidetes bacterium]|nr:benzoyl-CoA reductase subunit A [Bacteroidota bacterium]
MNCFIGIDLGSTTSKAIFMNEQEKFLGRGITNSRSNYHLACQIAREEAENNSRFSLLEQMIRANPRCKKIVASLMPWLFSRYRLSEYNAQLRALRDICATDLNAWKDPVSVSLYREVVEKILRQMAEEAVLFFQSGASSKSDFFRDIATSQFMDHAQDQIREHNGKITFDRLIGIFDRAIIRVESISFARAFSENIDFAYRKVSRLPEFLDFKDDIYQAVKYADEQEFNIVNIVGTGYGRQRLPFDKKQLRSEILCHGLGAHYMFPKTRTVLDIGGQDTKAIQIDANGIVENFQMNDRCAAGCGRYLGYVADEMNMGVHELGPQALKATKMVRINSTCTVFAGAELRQRLALGEKREDILAGLHRAIILRAMSLLARSGGINNEFTFTGGVAKNQAATGALKKLVLENYGNIKINVSPDSIYTGACGAALFAGNSK